MSFLPITQLPRCPQEWLWPGHLPVGHLVLTDGDPKVGKSLLTLDLCGRITTGRPFPDGAAASPAANVIILNAEDNARDTINPRLAAAGADLNRVSIWHHSPNEPWLTLPQHVRQLDEAIAQTRAKFVV